MLRHGLAIVAASLFAATLFGSCDEGLTFCRMPCERDEDCASPGAELSRCEDQRCFFIGCQADADCADGEGCVELADFYYLRFCRQLCAADGSCSAMYNSCFDTKDGRGVCLEDCRKGGCIEEAECDEDTGYCYCEDDSGCFGGVCE